MAVLEREPKLLRRLGFWETLSVGVGSTIGGSIFVVLGDAARMAGPGVLLSLAIGAAVTLVIALNYGELATSLPVSGGGYVFTREAVGGLASFTTGWFLWIGNMLYAAMNAVGFALILNIFFPVEPILVAELVLALFCLANMRGIKEAVRTQLVLTVVLVSGLLGLSLASLGTIRPEALTTPSFMPKGLSGVLAATGLTFVAYWGFESITTVSGEVKKPGKTIPRACVLAVLISGAIYIFVAFASVGVLGWTALASSSTPLVLLGRVLMGSVGELLVSGLGAVATLTSLNAALISAARISYALGRDGLLPSSFGDIHERFRTPYKAIGLSTLIAGLFALSGIVHFLAEAASFGFLMGLLMVNTSMVFLRRKRRYLPRDFKAPAYPLTPVLAVIACSGLLAFMDPLVLAVGTGIAVIGTLVFLFELATPKTRELGVGGFSLASALSIFTLIYLVGLEVEYLPDPRLSSFLSSLFFIGAVIQLISSVMCAFPLGEFLIHIARPLGAVEEPGAALPGRAIKAVKTLELLMGITQTIAALGASLIMYGALRGALFFPSFPTDYYGPLLVIVLITLAFFSLSGLVCGYTLLKRRYASPVAGAQGT